MPVPGPSVGVWGLELVALAALLCLAGEGLRSLLASRIRLLAWTEPVEIALLDVYLGAGLLYVWALLPLGLFTPVGVAGLLLVAVAAGLVRFARRRGRAGLVDRLRRAGRSLATVPYLVTAAAGLTVLVLELAAAAPVPTGNSYDSSVDGLFVALLQLHGTMPFTLAPVAVGTVSYPQGLSTVFLLGQWVGNLPPARTSLLVTPLFQAAIPLAGFAVGRRWFGAAGTGAVAAVAMAVLLPTSRFLVAGSNDFVLALPLVLCLAARLPEWLGPRPVDRWDAVGFGGLAGISAAMNPVGAEWLLVALPVAALASGTFRIRRSVGAWWLRWVLALAATLLWVVPSVIALAVSRPSPAPGAAVRVASPGNLLSLTDPFLFEPSNLSRSPFLFLQVELAVLLVAGVALLLFWKPRSTGPPFTSVGALAVGGGASALLWLAAAVGGYTGLLPPVIAILTSPGELSVLLFLTFGMVCLVPLAALVGEVAALENEPLPRRRATNGTPWERPVVALGVVALLLAPGMVLTVDGTPGVLDSTYRAFSNVTAGDFALLAWAPGHLPNGARVLVAPGSAGEFLPGYDPSLEILFPMYGPDWNQNASYLDLRHLLPNGTLGATGAADLSALQVEYVVVTGNTTVLLPAFSPEPFLTGVGFQTLFHSADAYVFERR